MFQLFVTPRSGKTIRGTRDVNLFVHRNITGFNNRNLSLALSDLKFLCMSAEAELEVKFSNIY
jgi:hypothetical protein